MYPILVDLKNRPVLVVGGGHVASRKITTLVSHGAKVTVVSPDLNEAIDQDSVKWIKRTFQESDLEGYLLVFACTDNQLVNHLIRQNSPICQLVNNTGDKHDSDFYNMKFIEMENVMISVSTQGQSAKLSKAIGNEIKKWAIEKIPEIVKRLGNER